jgi:hypothetical protein
MGNTTRTNEVYIIATDMSMLNEDIQNSHEESNEYQVWGERGITQKLISISNAKEFVESWYNVEGL